MPDREFYELVRQFRAECDGGQIIEIRELRRMRTTAFLSDPSSTDEMDRCFQTSDGKPVAPNDDGSFAFGGRTYWPIG